MEIFDSGKKVAKEGKICQLKGEKMWNLLKQENFKRPSEENKKRKQREKTAVQGHKWQGDFDLEKKVRKEKKYWTLKEDNEGSH